MKKVFLKCLQISQESTCVVVSFSQVLSFEISLIVKSTYFEKHLRGTVFINLSYTILLLISSVVSHLDRDLDTLFRP